MSSILDPADHFGDPDRVPMLTRVAHLMPWLLATYLVFAASNWLGLLPSSISTIAACLMIAAQVGTIVAELHTAFARLCVRCMDEVPADASARAGRSRKLLRLAHWANAHTWWYVGVLLALGVAPLALGAASSRPDLNWLFAPRDILFVTVLWSEWLHHRYRPWCPYCRRWDDGDGMREPSPDPTGSDTKTSA